MEGFFSLCSLIEFHFLLVLNSAHFFFPLSSLESLLIYSSIRGNSLKFDPLIRIGFTPKKRGKKASLLAFTVVMDSTNFQEVEIFLSRVPLQEVSAANVSRRYNQRIADVVGRIGQA